MRKILLAFCVLVALAFSSCKLGTQTPLNEGLLLDTLTVDTVCPLYHNYATPACRLKMTFEAPSSDVPADIRRHFDFLVADMLGYADEDGQVPEGEVVDLLEAYTRSYLFSYLQEGKEAIENYDNDTVAVSTWMNYEEECSGKVVYNAKGFISYKLSRYDYTGGAHGSTSVASRVFDCSQLRALNLNDVFGDVIADEVSILMQQQLMAQFECAALEDLEKVGFFNPSELGPTDNFVIGDEGIEWIYDPVQIAPFALGVISVQLSWNDLYPFLASDSPLMPLAQPEKTE